MTITTLFLLQQMEKESTSGRRFERLRQSIPMWLQMLMVLLLIWLLVAPRWPVRDSVRKVAVVLDASSSMSVFTGNARDRLVAAFSEVENTFDTVEYVVIESTLVAGNVYYGTDLKALGRSVEAWRPSAGAHDFGPSLRVARGLVGRDGVVMLVTDHIPDEPPRDAVWLAVGEPKENVGFAGVAFEEKDGGRVWRALVRNYSDQPQTRTWGIEKSDNTVDIEGEGQGLVLGPGLSVAIGGPLPTGREQWTVRLSGDAYELDDVLPMVAPRRKPLKIETVVGEKYRKLAGQLVGAFSGGRSGEAVPVAGEPDLLVFGYQPGVGQMPETNAIVMVDDSVRQGKYALGNLVREDHALIEGLNWQSLLNRECRRVPAKEQDEVLLWQGEVPLVFLRRTGDFRRLVLNFDVAESNAPRLASFAVLVHRFLEGLRADKVWPENRNLEMGQRFSVATHTGKNSPPVRVLKKSNNGDEVAMDIPGDRAVDLVAPTRPGFIEVRQGDEKLLAGAVHFSDAREADLTKAASSADPVIETISSEQTSWMGDRFWRWWVMLLVLVALVCWWFCREKPIPETSDPMVTS